MEHPEYTPENALNADEFAQQVASNPMAALRRFQELQAQIDALRVANNTPSTSSPGPPVPQTPSESSELINALVQALSRRSSPPTTASVRLSEKLPDIEKYEGDRDNLDAWEQSLIQRMNINHDRYPTDLAKIAYAESRLTIGKKASNLMMPYRKDGICTIPSFAEYRRTLRHCCGNPFEEEDARTYLRDGLKQGSTPFLEYYQLFCQKKDRSGMDDPTLVDCYKRNVNYNLQLASLPRVTATGQRPMTFADYTQVFMLVDEELRQLQHRLPRVANTPTQGSKAKTAATTPALPSKPAPATLTIPIATAGDDPMDLSSAMAMVQGKPLSTPGVKDICLKWKLCFYCKQQHLGKNAKDCPNKKDSSLRAADLDDNTSMDGGVSLPGKV